MTTQSQKKLLGVVIVFMICVLLALCAVLATGVRRVGRHNSIASFQEFLTARRAHGPLMASDVNLIRPWMTFDYINQLFALPTDYLKDTLNIANPHYPNISLTEYTESFATTSRAVLFDAVKTVISQASTTQQ